MDRNCLTDSIIGYDAILEFNYDANILERLKKLFGSHSEL